MITPTLNLQRQAEALAQAQKRWREAGPSERRTRALTVAITREAGTPGGLIAETIGARLGWPVYDRGLVEKIALEMGLRAELLDSVDERHKSLLLECVEAMTAAGPISEAKYVRHLVEVVFSLAAHGNCVIVGRGAAQILPADGTLRVRLVGDKQDRIAHAQRTMSLSVGEAAQWVAQKDRERTAFVRDHFLKDPNDASMYDLILNTSRWTAEQCADFIVDAVKKLEGGA